VRGSQPQPPRLGRAAPGAPVGPPLDHPDGPVDMVAFRPDGKVVATASGKAVRFWETATGQPAFAALEPASYPVVFSPDGQTVLTGAAVAGPGAPRRGARTRAPLGGTPQHP